MAWNPFSFDNFDIETLPSVSTDCCFDTGIVNAEENADDSSDNELFTSYQLTKESSVFEEAEEILDDEIEECGSKCKKEHCGSCGEDDVDECGDLKKNIFDETDDILADYRDDEVEECGSKCKKECGDTDDEVSPFEEAEAFLKEAVLDDGEDDTVIEDLDDLPEDDDEEIEADAEGIEEIEADIIDDEEDDLIDMAMDGE